MGITVTLPEELENKVQEAAARNGRARQITSSKLLKRLCSPPMAQTLMTCWTGNTFGPVRRKPTPLFHSQPFGRR